MKTQTSKLRYGHNFMETNLYLTFKQLNAYASSASKNNGSYRNLFNHLLTCFCTVDFAIQAVLDPPGLTWICVQKDLLKGAPYITFQQHHWKDSSRPFLPQKGPEEEDPEENRSKQRHLAWRAAQADEGADPLDGGFGWVVLLGAVYCAVGATLLLSC